MCSALCCRNSPSLPGDLSKAHQNAETRQLTEETKCAMSWVHFVAGIWHRYIHVEHTCEFLDDGDTMGDVLQHVAVFGGAARDLSI